MIKKFINLMNLQRTSLAIGIFGISFQVFVLNPWHNKIFIQLNSLENKINKIINDKNINNINKTQSQ